MEPSTTDTLPQSGSPLALFQSPVRIWFERRFPQGPSDPQARGWPCIATGQDTLIAAPTGSGKTLAAFLVCIDRFYSAAEALRSGEGLPLFTAAQGVPNPDMTTDNAASGPEVIYVSPLKALAADIQHNLQEPLAEIAEVARSNGAAVPEANNGNGTT